MDILRKRNQHFVELLGNMGSFVDAEKKPQRFWIPEHALGVLGV